MGDQKACLAQSPQLYKQMVISGDFDRVYEIGPVFRAEKSHTRRHLCEYTGLDLEMRIKNNYHELLHIVHNLIIFIFQSLELNHEKELSLIREHSNYQPIQYTDQPCIVTWKQAQEILQREGYDIGDGMNDLSTKMELFLGSHVRKTFKTDMFILEHYPTRLRPFYTLPNPHDIQYSYSYDIFLRGMELGSGSQRCHDSEQLLKILKDQNISTNQGLQDYITSFQYGMYPHAGIGMGLERFVFMYLGLDNIRQASMFPRDPNRLNP